MSVQDITGSRTFVAVTPADTGENLLNGAGKPPKGIYVGVAGTVIAVDFDGSEITFLGAAAGSVLPIRPRRIMSTGTTATDMVALY